MQGCQHDFCILAELPSLLSLGLVRLVDGHVAEDGETLLDEELDGRSIGKVERRVARQILIRVDVGEVSEARHPHSVALGPVSDQRVELLEDVKSEHSGVCTIQIISILHDLRFEIFFEEFLAEYVKIID